jgi:hypothetical protein
MSAAASRLRSESPSSQPNESLPAKEHEHERQALERLTGASRTSSKPIIAVDLDDVLSQTNEAVAECEHPLLWRRGAHFSAQGITRHRDL